MGKSPLGIRKSSLSSLDTAIAFDDEQKLAAMGSQVIFESFIRSSHIPSITSNQQGICGGVDWDNCVCLHQQSDRILDDCERFRITSSRRVGGWAGSYGKVAKENVFAMQHRIIGIFGPDFNIFLTAWHSCYS